MNSSSEQVTEVLGPLPKPKGRLRRWTPWLLYSALILLIGGSLLTWLLKLQPAHVVSVAAWFRKGAQLGALIQVGLCCWVIASWRAIVALGFRHGYVAKHELRALLGLRWRAAGALAIYLALVPIGAGSIARFILGLIP